MIKNSRKSAIVAGAIVVGLSGLFMYCAGAQESSPPPNYLLERDVLFILGCGITEPGQTEEKTVKKGSDYVTYSSRNSPDGKVFELELSTQINGQNYRTYLQAERAIPRTLAVNTLIFDNETEPLRNPKEIYSALNYIGNTIRIIHFNQAIPGPHKNEGRFSPLGRLMTRILPKPN